MQTSIMAQALTGTNFSVDNTAHNGISGDVKEYLELDTPTEDEAQSGSLWDIEW